MKICYTVTELNQILDNVRSANNRIGLVPTMGALHEGHISLVAKSKARSKFTVMSIFVNPLQFNNSSDLEKYPRTLERDSEMAKAAGVDLLFVPDVKAIYPELNQPNSTGTTRVLAGSCSLPLEGKFRPGHFDGVVTVVSILFNLVRPDVAIFGEKDFQQVKVIEQMVRDLHFQIEIITAPTIREKDGLAMSSRNVRLSAESRARALTISKSLLEATKMVQEGEIDSAKIEVSTKALMEQKGDLKVEYAAVVDRKTLSPVSKITQSCQMVIAAWCDSNGDSVRLIDNIELKP